MNKNINITLETAKHLEENRRKVLQIRVGDLYVFCGGGE